ncbi:MAG TPA: helix-turn-helix transcriptional regulator [Bryobacteraceae bacterium]|nr:helix-turn-helix transcriptional regulator [Bryobacteraceae bacterium]
MSPLHTRNHAPGIEVNSLIGSSPAGAESAVASLLALARSLQDRRLRKVVEMIQSESLDTVHDLAVEVNLSPSHLQHLFKEQTGVCITQLLSEQRLRKAARLLQTSDLSVKEIAFAAGYEHASSFVRAFHRRFAQTPRDYRQQNFQQTQLTK